MIALHRFFPLAVMLSLLAAACSPARLLNAVIPTSGLERITDVAYGPGERQRLDIYIPKERADPAPVVVFFYGGNWQGGEKENYLFAAQALASLGVIAVVPDYRVYPAVRYPAFLEDSAAAVRWVARNIGAHGGDPAALFLAGHSAGAYNAAMLALDRGRWLPEIPVRGWIGLAGPYDFLPLTDPALIEIFGGPMVRSTQPIVYAGPGDPPALLLHGDGDRTVRPANSTRLAEALRQAGVPVEVELFDGIGHVGLVASLAGPLRFRTPALERIGAFLKTHR